MQNGYISVSVGLTFLGLAFGAWAWVVYWGVTVIRAEVKDLKIALKQHVDEYIADRRSIEHRMTELESVARWCTEDRHG